MSVVNSQIAYILHKRAFRESSMIVDFFTPEHGVLSLMTRGGRGAKSKISSNMLPFTPLVISWQGRSGLPYLKTVERADLKAPVLQKRALYSAMYINELLMRLLHKDDVHEDLFRFYHQCLFDLADHDNIELCLRTFELQLLEGLGFGLMAESDVEEGVPVDANKRYYYIPGYGAVQNLNTSLHDFKQTAAVSVSGECLLAIASKSIENAMNSRQIRNELKLLMRAVIDYHLGYRTLKSRELFMSLQSLPAGH
jgi:DNA repair protein RecO (recombination protein O)